MRLVAKFTAALIGGIFVILAASAYLQVQRNVVIFEADMAADQSAIAQALRTEIEHVASIEGTAAAQATVAMTDRAQSHVNIRWVWLDQSSPGARVLMPESGRAAIARGREVRLVERDDEGVERILTYAPIATPEGRLAAVEVSEPLAPQRAFLRANEMHAVTVTLLLVLTCALVATGLGIWLVGRPMLRLREQARRVGAGDLSIRVPVHRGDEIGDLGREFNAMCDRLAEANARVAAETEARIAALEQLRHADRLRTVGQLASGIAHELGTPLNVVAGRAKMIVAGRPADDDAGQNARIIVQQAERMTDTIRQLLDFSRRRGPRLAEGDLCTVARRSADLLAPLAESRGVAIQVDAAEPTLPARLDQNQLQQAIVNLMMNGIHAMPRGGTLRLETDRATERPPREHGGAEAEFARLAIADEGVGIAPEHLAHLFEPFFTTKDVGEGTGLGLAVAWGIVREHGGWISVDSAVGRGSRFVVHLPAAGVDDRREAVA